jgi:ABC-type sulfate transport system substrate-binding protein
LRAPRGDTRRQQYGGEWRQTRGLVDGAHGTIIMLGMAYDELGNAGDEVYPVSAARNGC